MRAVGAKFYLSVVVSVLAGLAPGFTGKLYASHNHKVDGGDVTAPLFELLDSAYGGKLTDFYVLADTFTDPASGEQYRHVLRLDYDKSRGFGRLRIYVRSVGKMTPEQLAVYTPQQIYDFGETDLEKFVKSDRGPFGETGDLYLQAKDGGPLHTFAVTDDARKEYDDFVTQYLIPALQQGHKTS